MIRVVPLRYLFFPLLLLCITQSAYAYVPLHIEETDLKDVKLISNPEVIQSYYGQLHYFPYTFEIRAERPFRLKVQILAPDVSETQNNLSGIIVREVEGSGRVEEVTRLPAQSASWDPTYEWLSGDHYRAGPSFDGEVKAGVYHIEVSTPENLGKYILAVGYHKGNGHTGYVETLHNIMAVKAFLEKPPFMIIESPLIYLPLLSIFGIIFFFGYLRMRKVRMDML